MSTLAIIVLLSFSINLSAAWAIISTEELVRDTDLILIGTLQDVTKFTNDNIDYSEGVVLVEKVIAGSDITSAGQPLRSGDKIEIKWKNSSMIACPRVEHKGHENIRGIWLLKVESDGTLISDYSWRFSSIDELDKLKKILRKTKVRSNPTKIMLMNEEPSPLVEAQSITEEHSHEREDKIDSLPRRQGYSPSNAGVVLLFCICLYYFLYRSRFRIR